MKIEVSGGFFSYKKTLPPVLSNINFEASEGDVLAILAPNGAGKTTLLRCTMGFLKWSKGRSLLNGKEISSIPARELWKTISYVPQAKQVSSSFSVREMILLGRTGDINLFSLPSSEDIKKTDTIISKLALEKIADKRCSEISGGELQMALIARALVSEPKILILDEPESNLDFKNQLIVLNTITALSSEGVCCIFNTHYPAHALRRANKTLILSPDGSHVFGATREIITEGNIEKIFGVNAIISDIESKDRIFQDVVPIDLNSSSFGLSFDTNSQSKENKLEAPKKAVCTSSVATVSIIFSESDTSLKINRILHEYSAYIVGRMGMPYKKAGVRIINLILDAPITQIQALTDRLNLLPDISVKTTFGREVSD